jgi:hypothetical protein
MQTGSTGTLVGPANHLCPSMGPGGFGLRILVYTIYLSHMEGREGELNQREGERGNSSQSWVENTNMADCISSL